MQSKIRKFKLSEQFLEGYRDRTVPWGPIGYVTFKRTYSRRLDEFEPGAQGTEEWWQTCRRVIEGMFNMQKKHIVDNGLEWNDAKAQKTAKEAYERLFTLKWTPPGRGLWMMGTDFVENKTAAGLLNCAFRSTEDLAEKGGYIFRWVMDALMLGIGVGFDTLGAGTLTVKIPGSSSPNVKVPIDNHNKYQRNDLGENLCIIADSREGWVEATQVLLDAFFFGSALPVFDYSEIRPYGELIKGFGGTSSGSGPLKLMHEELVSLYSERIGRFIKSTDIVDTENFIGKCVVAGNVRRSAALALGKFDDLEYLTMKNDKDKLYSHRWGSNNSFEAKVGIDYSWHANQMQINGEPGAIWLDNARSRGRFKDAPDQKDAKVMGFNPCGEQPLFSGEMCCLVETFPALHDSYEDYLRTLKIAYLYGKTVTLGKTPWPETNAVMLKNRRIGLSMSGVIQAFNKFGRREVLDWCDKGYEYVQNLDQVYSDWFCIPRSIRTNSIKPSGTVSILNGSTPGIHFPEDEYYLRRIRFADNSDLLEELGQAGYHIEPCKYSPNTMVVAFPVQEPFFVKGKRDVSMWEQLEIAASMQHYWADNGVSVTITFKPSEASQIKDALQMYEGRLKAVSFLKYEETGYEQAPYEPITKEMYETLTLSVVPIQRFSNIKVSGVGTKFCDGDSCLVEWAKPEQEVQENIDS